MFTHTTYTTQSRDTNGTNTQCERRHMNKKNFMFFHKRTTSEKNSMENVAKNRHTHTHIVGENILYINWIKEKWKSPMKIKFILVDGTKKRGTMHDSHALLFNAFFIDLYKASDKECKRERKYFIPRRQATKKEIFYYWIWCVCALHMLCVTCIPFFVGHTFSCALRSPIKIDGWHFNNLLCVFSVILFCQNQNLFSFFLSTLRLCSQLICILFQARVGYIL